MTGTMSQPDQLFLGLAIAFLPLQLAYVGWMSWRIKANAAIQEARAVLSWQQVYTEQRFANVLDLGFVGISIALLVLGYWSQAWMRDLLSLLVSVLGYGLFLLGMTFIAARLASREKPSGTN